MNEPSTNISVSPNIQLGTQLFLSNAADLPSKKIKNVFKEPPSQKPAWGRTQDQSFAAGGSNLLQQLPPWSAYNHEQIEKNIEK